MRKGELVSRKRLGRRLLSQDSWGEAVATGTERKGLVGEVPRKTQQHLVRTCGWQGCLAGSGGLQSKAEMMPILVLGRLGGQ